MENNENSSEVPTKDVLFGSYSNFFDDFNSDEDNIINLNMSDNEDFDYTKNELKRNRRKATTPQKAFIKLEGENTESFYIENNSESSQGSNEFITKVEHDTNEIFDNDFESDDILQELNAEEVLKDLKSDEIDDVLIDNVKEEFKANWGIKCNRCEQIFSFKTEFDKHYVTSYTLQPVYTCKFCNKSSEKYSSFRSHCYRHITDGRFKCSQCPKKFSLQSLLQVHILAKHSKTKPFECDECGKQFVTKPGLKIHIKRHKSEVKEDYPCVECGKVLHTRGGLTSHMNVHRLGRRFMCDVCGKTFTQKVNMKQHVKQHTGDKPHSCDKCDKSFAERSHLIRHLSFHSKERPFKCETCQKMYKTERCLKVHSLVHSSNRPFTCGYCGKGFLSSTKLKQHYNIHTGERPYKCKHCERTFTNYPNLLKHTRRRHKVDHKTGEKIEQPSNIKKSQKSQKEHKEKARKNDNKSQEIIKNEIVEKEDLNSVTTDDNECEEKSDEFVHLMKEELLLQQAGLINFPLIDDKALFSQNLDLYSGNPSSSVNYMVPYFQATLPNQQSTQQAVLPMSLQFNDLVMPNFIQTPCE